jgi:Fe-S-cluster-containing dehydrogenase component
MNKRDFLKGMIVFVSAEALLPRQTAATTPAAPASGPTAPDGAAAASRPAPRNAGAWYGMGIEVDKCIGCARCVEACKAENDVPAEPFFFRTWVERYAIKRNGEVEVESIASRDSRTSRPVRDDPDVIRTFFLPKLCNHCASPPCVQVCPVGATFTTKDGVVLVDKDRCVGCRYCIQACPYGARYLDPRSRTADKCTFCYHRLAKGLQPACVEVCPTQARIFGDLRSRASRLVRFERVNKIHVLKPSLNTNPKVFYAGLDGEAR